MNQKAAARARETTTERLMRKAYRFRLRKSKLSTRNLDRLCRENASDVYTLVVHSEDVDYKPYFPNAYAVTKRKDVPADRHVDVHYNEVSELESGSFDLILCTGLLEHLPNPQKFVNEMHRILRPGGKLIISASAVFSFHECPNNFFHFTPYGFRLLFKDWAGFQMLRGASQPFETIGILLQRILLQCDIFPPLRPFVELAAVSARFFDRFIVRQYDTREFKTDASLTDSMLPSNIQAVVLR